MGINNPIPRSLKSETKKAAKVLRSFVKPNQIFGADQVIPPYVLKRAKGLAIITVLKAGFLFSGRAGSGVIVARLKDGTWSAPSAIAMAGAGAGGMVGVELTDFVFILNSEEAVRSFSEFGTITLGGNVSVSAGPLGRSAEAAASASTGGVSAVFAYSKSKGLFAGVSVEGSAILERREANRKFYGDNCTSKMILSGRVKVPPAADPLLRILESRAFNFTRHDHDDNASGDDFYDDGQYSDNTSHYYDDIPDSFDSTDESSTRPNTRSSRRRGMSLGSRSRYDDDYDDDGYGRGRGYGDFDSEDEDYDYGRSPNRNSSRNRGPQIDRGTKPRANTRWEDDLYDRDTEYSRPNHSGRDYDNTRGNRRGYGRERGYSLGHGPTHPSNMSNVDDLSHKMSKTGLGNESTATNSATPTAVALYNFAGEQPGDLAFKKGDVITILKKSDSQNDWWTGRTNGKEGIFPANYVRVS
ncbi:AEG_G0023810.mRNA.1.CDS.1 [Saccharomyces cerevisiae]|nr:Ysc84p [Saccharomyces cerevisiae YJM541]AJU30899.1 Ysc84p [Saccharomyces cerevisiae YJM682]AJU31153.1 Ysc84p [Saccharomyces cerevisiae YJM683]AJV30509.1 Ysc84p [Saccharomyces cerevisiae YJM1307]AJV31033.1 Ysc84p [Saccharomyces cerevisiae YJM1326]CAI4501104.1 BHH_G0023480.mRNA.1.CDS.1 [Saccharomyces cerevisiae]